MEDNRLLSTWVSLLCSEKYASLIPLSWPTDLGHCLPKHSRDSPLSQVHIFIWPPNWNTVSQVPPTYFLQNTCLALLHICTTPSCFLPQNIACWFLGCLASWAPSCRRSTEYLCSTMQPLNLLFRSGEILLKRVCIDHDRV